MGFPSSERVKVPKYLPIIQLFWHLKEPQITRFYEFFLWCSKVQKKRGFRGIMNYLHPRGNHAFWVDFCVWLAVFSCKMRTSNPVLSLISFRVIAPALRSWGFPGRDQVLWILSQRHFPPSTVGRHFSQIIPSNAWLRLGWCDWIGWHEQTDDPAFWCKNRMLWNSQRYRGVACCHQIRHTIFFGWIRVSGPGQKFVCMHGGENREFLQFPHTQLSVSCHWEQIASTLFGLRANQGRIQFRREGQQCHPWITGRPLHLRGWAIV